MINLTIGNSYSTIKGFLNDSQEKLLREALSYTVGGKSAFFSSYGPRKKCLLTKNGEFPTGLIHKVADYLTPGVSIVNDLRVKPKSKPVPFFTKDEPYEWQLSATRIATQKCRGIISAPTGTGKSMLMALLLARLNVLTLVVVPSLEIKKQLVDVLGFLPNVTIENIDSPKLKSMTNYDCLIIDEAHHVAAKTYQKLNKTAWNNIYYRFFLTATPFRNDDEETLLFESIAGQVIYRLDYKIAIDKGYIVPVESYHIEMPTQKTEAFTYAQVYKELVVENTPRNFAIAGVLTRLHSAKKSTLCLVKEVKHGEILSEITGLPFVSGADDKSRDYIRHFNSGGIKVLIATTGIMGEGIDSKPCEYVVIAGLGKAKSQFMQQVGRAVRKSPGKESAKVILIKDKSHKFLTRHFNAQRAILKDEYGVLCPKLELE